MEESFMVMGTGNLLDPSAQEFYPQYALPHPQIYYPYPPPPPPPPPLPHPLPLHYVQPPHATIDDGFTSRAVVLSMVPPHVTESTVAQSMTAFGGVRAIDAHLLISDGIVTVHFYDLRAAQVAVAEIRDQHVRQQSRLGQQFFGISSPENWAVPSICGRGLIDGQAVWAQFAAMGLDVVNQGLLFVIVSDPAALSSDAVREIFQAFGPVMEVRESPSKPQHKFVEFFDVRDAARALTELNCKEVAGVRLFVEFSRPGGGQYQRSYDHHHRHSKGPGHQSFPLPPRLARSDSQASGSSSGSRGNQEIVVLKKNDATIRNVYKNVNAKGGGGGNSGKRGKGSRSINTSSNSYPSSSSSKQQQQQQQQGKRSWKNHINSNKNQELSSRFEFKQAGVAVAVAVGGDDGGSISSSSSSCRDSRTTVMIKNIPNKYSQKLMLNMLDNHCIHCNEQIVGGGDGGEEPLSAYDFVYLPIDFNNKCNVGYGFVNLTSPEAAVRLYKAFHMQPWEVFNSRKICQVTYARLQGLEVLKEHFKSSRFACDNDEYMPVVFSPPRDGMQLTDPLPIGGRSSIDLLLAHGVSSNIRAAAAAGSDVGGASSTTASTQAPSDNGDDDDEADGGGCDGTPDELAAGVQRQLQLESSSS